MDRFTVAQAADRLGVKEQAVRKRIQRGTLVHDKDEDGRVYVYLDPRDQADGTGNGNDTDKEIDTLVQSLQDQIEYLRAELQRGGQPMRRSLGARTLSSPSSPSASPSYRKHRLQSHEATPRRLPTARIGERYPRSRRSLPSDARGCIGSSSGRASGRAFQGILAEFVQRLVDERVRAHFE